MKTNIVLIGFMGAGKTTVGKLLAEKLDYKFIELDGLVERRAGKKIADIFNEDGEIAFREMEMAAVKEIGDIERAVIACGGGVVLNQINMMRLRQKALTIYLIASPAVILKRALGDGETRPLLKTQDKASQIHRLLKSRQPLYEMAADIKIDTSGEEPSRIADEIIRKLKKNESFAFAN